MTPRVNLLPVRYVERAVERRRAGATAAGMLALLLVLSLVGVIQARQLAAAEEQRDVEQARTAQLQARRAELAPFRELAERVRSGQQLIAAAMRTEVSWAGVLASLSASFPADASLTAFTGESTMPVFGGEVAVQPGDEVAVQPGDEVAVQPGDETSPIGSTTFNGYSVEGFAPGIADVLRRLGGVSGLSEPRLATGALGEIGETPVTTFDGGTLLDGAALTGRYVDGLPPGDHVDVPALGGGVTTAPTTPDGPEEPE